MCFDWYQREKLGFFLIRMQTYFAELLIQIFCRKNNEVAPELQNVPSRSLCSLWNLQVSLICIAGALGTRIEEITDREGENW